MNSESKKLSEEPESTSPLKANGVSGDRRVVCNDLETDVVVAPRCRVGSPVNFRQSAPGEVRGLLVLFSDVRGRWRWSQGG